MIFGSFTVIYKRKKYVVMGKNKNEQMDPTLIKELLDKWETNNTERKQNERELLNRTINALMLNEIQEIIDRQNEAYQRCQRNRNKRY